MLIVLLSLLLTPMAAFVMLRTAPAQTFMARQMAAYLSTQLHTEVSIGSFRLNWFLNAVITDIRILDKHHQVILQAKKIKADVKSIDVNKRQLPGQAVSSPPCSLKKTMVCKNRYRRMW